MSDTLEVITPVESKHVVEDRNTRPSRLWPRLALAAVTLISIFMNFFQLGQNGFANLYYASAIRSMLDNWHTQWGYHVYAHAYAFRMGRPAHCNLNSG